MKQQLPGALDAKAGKSEESEKVKASFGTIPPSMGNNRFRNNVWTQKTENRLTVYRWGDEADDEPYHTTIPKWGSNIGNYERITFSQGVKYQQCGGAVYVESYGKRDSEDWLPLHPSLYDKLRLTLADAKSRFSQIVNQGRSFFNQSFGPAPDLPSLPVTAGDVIDHVKDAANKLMPLDLGDEKTREAMGEAWDRAADALAVLNRFSPSGTPISRRAASVETGTRFWKASEFKGQRVYQRNDLFDPETISSWKVKGKTVTGTNMQRMASGRAPIGYDGKSVVLHHLIQEQSGAVAEVSQTMHQGYYNTLHINTGKLPSGIDRTASEGWKSRYWMKRASDFR